MLNLQTAASPGNTNRPQHGCRAQVIVALFSEKNSAVKEIVFTFALPTKGNGPVAQLNRAFDYGSKGFRFES